MSATPEKALIREIPNSQESRGNSPDDRTGLSLAVMILVLGASAGMLFYTKRTGSMLQSLRTVTTNPEQRILRGPTQLGPKTKAETERMQPRIEKDEFY
jgi:hypothetical protein